MKAFSCALFTTGVLASLSPPSFIKRQLVEVPCSEQGYKDCGDSCILPSYTCCPDGNGGCPSTSYCVTSSNGEVGCCPRGETCEGGGGVDTDTILLTSTIWDDTTSTIWEGSTSTAWDETSVAETSTATPTLLPEPVPSNGTTGEPTAVPTAAANGLVANLFGGVAAGVAALLL